MTHLWQEIFRGTAHPRELVLGKEPDVFVAKADALLAKAHECQKNLDAMPKKQRPLRLRAVLSYVYSLLHLGRFDLYHAM